MYLRKTSSNEQQKQSVKSFYQQQFSPLFTEKNPSLTAIDTSFIDALPESNLSLQFSFISENQFPIDEKSQLMQSPFVSSYDGTHSYYHPIFKRFAEDFNIDDIYLITADTQTVAYSINKDVDFATSLKDGPFSNSALAKLIQDLLNSTEKQTLISDSQPYAPALMDNRIFMATSINDSSNKITGILVFELTHHQINNIMSHQQQWQEVGLGQSGETFLVAADNTLRSEPRLLLEDKAMYTNALAGISQLQQDRIELHNSAIANIAINSQNVQQAISGEQGFDEFSEVSNFFSAFEPLDIAGLNWFIISEMDSLEVLSSVTTLKKGLTNIALLSTLLTCLLAVIAAVLFTKTILTPINQTVKLVNDIAKGDGDLRQRLHRTQQDELGDLSSGFDLFVSKLQNLLNVIAGNVNTLVDSSKTLQQSADNTKELTFLKHQEITGAASSIENMQLSSEQVFNGLEQASITTSNSINACAEGVEIIKTTKNANLQLRQQLAETALVVEQLSQDSTEITHVLSVIEQIAEQTNLLALNAAIESARAGELGRGFAVVADEVRALAQRTQQSTGQIKQIIHRLEQGSDSAVNAMNKSQTSSEQALEIADKREIFTKINDYTIEIGDINTLITQQSLEQKSNSQQVNINIANIEKLSENSNEDVLQLSAASAQLTSLADQLQQEISAYKT